MRTVSNQREAELFPSKTYPVVKIHVLKILSNVMSVNVLRVHVSSPCLKADAKAILMAISSELSGLCMSIKGCCEVSFNLGFVKFLSLNLDEGFFPPTHQSLVKYLPEESRVSLKSELIRVSAETDTNVETDP